MDIFGEKKYEELDIVTKLVEPINWSLLDTLATLPDEVELDKETIIKSVKRDLCISKRTAYERLIAPFHQNIKARGSLEKLYAMYALHMDEDLTVDLENNTVDGSIKIVKSKDSLTEKDLEYALRNAGPSSYAFESSFRINTTASQERAREILDIIGTDIALKAKSKRSNNSLISGLEQAYKDILRNDRWRIRDVDLADRLHDWINAYVSTGNTAAMRNFCLLKAATHRGYPLYGIDEEKI